jgi:hypothetical protein
MQKKGIGNKEEGIGRKEKTEGKAFIEMDSKPLLKHQKIYKGLRMPTRNKS